MSSAAPIPALFQPIQVGDITLGHRVVHAPLTRFRANKEHVHGELAVEYYTQRASVPGTLIISESTLISYQAGGWSNLPGIWNDEQIVAWRKITDAVHAKGSYIYLQLWALGRLLCTIGRYNQAALKLWGDVPLVAPSPIALPWLPQHVPRELTKDEIKEYVQWFATAAENGIKAGFDGVEIHGCYGCLVDQFIQDVSNERTDEYGGSIENRTRFVLEVVDAVVAAVGVKKTAIRVSPWNKFLGMGMEDPIPTYTHLVNQIKARHSDLAYIHVVSARARNGPNGGRNKPEDPSTVDFIHKLWAPRPTITTGGHTRKSALQAAEETGQIIGFGKSSISNPDLPFRLREDIQLSPLDCDEELFYNPESATGYTTYSFSEEFSKTQL